MPASALPYVIEDIQKRVLQDMSYQDEVILVLENLRNLLIEHRPRPTVSLLEQIFGPTKRTIKDIARYDAAHYISTYIDQEIKRMEYTRKPMKWAAELKERFSDGAN